MTLMQVRERLAAGSTLAAALAEHPRTFDELCVNLVEVGENTGRLDDALACVAKYKQKSAELRDRVFNALLYPLIILGLSLVVSVFLMTFVVPMLLSNLLEQGKALPWPTRVLQGLSQFLLTWKWWLLAAAGTIIVGLATALRTSLGRRLWDRFLVKIPLIGTMSRKQEISRISLVMSTLMASGLEFLKALEIASRTSRNTILHDSLETVAQQIRTGQELGPILERLDYFPPLVAHVFTVGQKSGQLEPMLLRLSEDYDRQVASLSQRLATIAEPLMIVFLAVIVGFILFATMLPILEAGHVL
jgi:type II secretory pathway component PulF